MRSAITAVIFDAGATRLVLEQDDSLLAWDARRLWQITGQVGCRDTLRYEHALVYGGCG